jgi:hypothetical protein
LFGTRDQLGYDSTVDASLEQLEPITEGNPKATEASGRDVDSSENSVKPPKSTNKKKSKKKKKKKKEEEEKEAPKQGGAVPKQKYRARLHWIFTVGGRQYKTTGDPLAYDGSYFLLSRGVRVWQVLEVGGDGKTLVLKDYHPWAASRTELEIQDDIFARLGDEQTSKARPYFLSIKHDESLSRTKDLPPNYQHQPWSLLASSRGRSSQSSVFSALGTRDVSPAESSKEPPQTKFPLRQHRRVVFNESCAVIPEITNFGVVLQCLKHIIEGVSQHPLNIIVIDSLCRSQFHANCWLCPSRYQRWKLHVGCHWLAWQDI